jgi:2'-5' RNA ligase
MPDKLRLFLALPLPASLRDPLARAQQGVDTQGLCVRWTLPETWHLTLHFLGATPAKLLEDLRHDLGACFQRHRCFDLSCQGLGSFPSVEEPRILWAGVADPHGHLARLHKDSKQVLDQYRLFKLPSEPYVPHLTLGRVQEQAASFDAPAFSRALRAWSSLGPWPVEEARLFHSRFTPEGPLHELLQSYPLARG